MNTVSAAKILEGRIEWVQTHPAANRVLPGWGCVIIVSCGAGWVKVFLLGKGEDWSVRLSWRRLWPACVGATRAVARHVGPNVALTLGGSLGRGRGGVPCRAGHPVSCLFSGATVYWVVSTTVPPLWLRMFTGVSFPHGRGTTPSLWDGESAPLHVNLAGLMGREVAEAVLALPKVGTQGVWVTGTFVQLGACYVIGQEAMTGRAARQVGFRRGLLGGCVGDAGAGAWVGSFADSPGTPLVMWDFSARRPLWPACPRGVAVGSAEVFKSGSSAVASWDITWVSHSCPSPPVELVLQAVPPVVPGVAAVDTGTVGVEHAVPVGVR